MASTYAHYRFGNEILNKLPNDIQRIIANNLDLFSIGLHGPDIFFYFHALKANETSAVGYKMHGKPANTFFEAAYKVINNSENQNASLSYILGFICHFALDSSCHPYIEKKINADNISHTEIEVEFDSYLMKKDGLNPLEHRLTDHIHPTPENAHIIHQFFPEVSEKKTLKSLRSIIFYNNLLLAPHSAKRNLIYFALKVSGNYKEMKGLLVSPQPVEKCKDSNEKLMELYNDAMLLAVKLITEYADGYKEYRPLPQVYKHTFGAE